MNKHRNFPNSTWLFLVVTLLLVVSSVLCFVFDAALVLIFVLAVAFTLLLLWGLNYFVIGKSDFRGSENEDVSNQVLGFLIAKVVMADGKSSESEMAVAKSRLQAMFSSKKVSEVLDSAYLNLQPSVNEIPYAAEVEQLKNTYDYLHLLAVAEMLFTIAVMQGGIVAAEWNFLQEVVALLDLNEADSSYLTKKYAVFRTECKQDGETKNDPYAVLGLTADATKEEVEKAYQTLSEKYNHRNIQDNTLKGVLTDKFKEIEGAYLKLMK